MALVCHSFHYSLSLGCANLCVCFIHCSVVVCTAATRRIQMTATPSFYSLREDKTDLQVSAASYKINPTTSFLNFQLLGLFTWVLVLAHSSTSAFVPKHTQLQQHAMKVWEQSLTISAYLLIKRSLSSKYFLVKYVFQLQYCLRAKARIPDSFSFFSCRSEQNE